MENIGYAPAGEQGIVMQFGEEMDEGINRNVRAMMLSLQTHPISGVIETIPTFTTLLILYDVRRIHYSRLERLLRKRAVHLNSENETQKMIYEIPVCYAEKYAPDLEQVAAYTGLTPAEVISLHTEKEYLIYMLGFLPGFVYLGGMNPKIFCPRLEVPRTKIPEGSVGIGGQQTGIYPLASPGGWRLIGKTPLKVYAPERNPAVIYNMGEYIRFYPISENEFDHLSRMDFLPEKKIVAERQGTL